MVVTEIRKRDGRSVAFSEEKIAKAITKAFDATYKPGYDETAKRLAAEVTSILDVEGIANPEVEHIQDIVERVLMENGYVQTAKAYILYRSERSRSRGDTAMGSMLKFGSEGAKQFYDMFVLNPDHARAHREGDIHIHDLDFLTLTTTCCQIDILKLFKDGFSTGHGTLREPNDIASYAALCCIAIQSNQNDQHGGQSVVNFDYGMAEGVRKTFVRLYRQNLARAIALLGNTEDPEQDVKAVVAALKEETGLSPSLEDCDDYFAAEQPRLMERFGLDETTACRCQSFAHERACKETDRATFQAMEALIHNLNTMHSRAGAQTPFSSINYGMDTSPEGRMVMKNILLTTEEGLGNGETPIFPIQIFRAPPCHQGERGSEPVLRRPGPDDGPVCGPASGAL